MQHFRILASALLLFTEVAWVVGKECKIGEYLREGECRECFVNDFEEYEPNRECTNMCNKGFPVKRREGQQLGYFCDRNQCSNKKRECSIGCAKAWHGDFCQHKCDCSNGNNMCDANGQCECKYGFHGFSCQLRCPSRCKRCDNGKCSESCVLGWFGENCDQRCSDNCNGFKCDPFSGKCSHGCVKSWYGDTCEHQCPQNCRARVETSCTNGVCDGCGEGYSGSKCNINCPSNCTSCLQHDSEHCLSCIPGRFGFSCNQSCDTCYENLCDISGVCTKGCKPNYHGKKCDERCRHSCLSFKNDSEICFSVNGSCKHGCKEGWYGKMCELNCGRGCKEDTCDRQTGECTNGCSGKVYGKYCNQTCPSGCKDTCHLTTGWCSQGCDNETLHGLFCNITCNCKGNSCINDSSDNGTCFHGCKDGYWGYDCQELCSLNCLDGICENASDSLTCTKGCEDGYWGHYCKHRCHSNCVGQVCEGNVSTYVSCTKGCKDGYWGRFCQHQCPCVVCSNKTHGFNCTLACSSECLNCTCKNLTVMEDSSRHLVMTILIPVVIISICVVTCTIFLVMRRKRRYVVNNSREESQEEIEDVTQTVEPSDLLSLMRDEHNPNLGSRIPISSFSDYVFSQKRNEGFPKQFDRLPINPVYPCYVSDLSKYAVKNRYGNIFPYDYNRVILGRNRSQKRRQRKSDYINASHVKGFTRCRNFIATQGPLSNKIGDFWEMVWQEDVDRIVMLCKCVENNRTKCSQYWSEEGETMTTSLASTVELLTENIHRDYTVRTIKLTREDVSREVTQFQLTTWPDMGVPRSTSSFLRFLTAVNNFQSIPGASTVVHCSAGVGRTGTYIAIDYLIEQAKAEGVVDVFECVLRLRHQRLNMVQTVEQYIFIHDVLKKAILSILPQESVSSCQETRVDLDVRQT